MSVNAEADQWGLPERLVESIRDSPCPFARRPHVTGRVARSLKDLRSTAQVLRSFCSETARHRDTVFCVAVQNPLPAGLHSLAALLHYTVHHASNSHERLRQFESVDRPEWRLRIASADLFVITLSSLYAWRHPRYTDSGSVILFQPELLFAEQGVTTGPARAKVTERVQRVFSHAGRPYTSAHAAGVPKAYRAITGLDGRGVEWWKTALPTDERTQGFATPQ